MIAGYQVAEAESSEPRDLESHDHPGLARVGDHLAVVYRSVVFLGRSPVSIQTQDVYGNAISAGVSVTYATDSASGGFASSSGGSLSPTLDVVIPSGSSTATAYYGDSEAGSPTITVSADGYQSASQPESIFQLYTTPPTTTISLTPASPNGLNGWCTKPVGVSVTATDNDPVAQTRCVLDPSTPPTAFAQLPSGTCALAAISTDGIHKIYAASEDDAGNIETPVEVDVKLDQTPPSLSPTVSPSSTLVQGQTGASASANATDATSGVASASCGPISTSTPGKHSVTCTATDNAGNTNTASTGYTVVADHTPPRTTIALTPPSPNGSNGWYTSAVGVKISAADSGSVAQTRCVLDPSTAPTSFDQLPNSPCSLSQVSTNGHHTIYAASIDAAGNQETSEKVSFQIDRTPPTIGTPRITPNTIYLHETGVSASDTATDAISGVASVICGAIDTSSAGDHTVTCTATDKAGNSQTASVHYTV